MPWTLYKFVFGELLKLLLTTLLVLVAVMSFGFAIPTITDGLLDALQVGKLVLYLMPMMLPYAAPIAASFSATVVYFRMVSDNEITACSALGISYFQILLPPLIVGLLLMGTMFYLSNWVIPDVTERVTAVIKQDIVTFVIKRIQRRQTVMLGNWIISAQGAGIDDVTASGEAPGEGQLVPFKRIIMQGVALGHLNRKTRQVVEDYTADMAAIDLYHFEGQTYATVRLNGATGYDPDIGLVEIGRADVTGIRLPSPFTQRIQFLSLSQLRRLRKNPDPYPAVAERRKALAEMMALEKVAEYITSHVDLDPGLHLLAPHDEQLIVTAPQVRQDNAVVHLSAGDGKPVIVRSYRKGKLQMILHAQSARMVVRNDPLAIEPTVGLSLNTATVYDPQIDRPITQRKQVPLGRCYVKPNYAEQLLDLPSDRLLAEAKQMRQTPALGRLADRLKLEIRFVFRDIDSQMNQRLAQPTVCLLAMLLAGVMAMRLRHQVALAIFFWCFVPTIVAIFMIAGGENIAGASMFPVTFGIVLTWAGPAMMLGLVLWVYQQLRRN